MKRKINPVSVFARISVLALFTVYPLIITNAYQNITKTKAYTFIFIAFAGLFLCYDAVIVSGQKRPLKKNVFSKTDIAFGFFLIVSLLSCVCSEYSGRFLSSTGRYFGFLMYLAFAAVYIFISRFYIVNKTEFIAFMSASFIIFVIGLMQFYGLNIFGLYNGIAWRSNIFMSLMGNINVYASFICISVPFAMYIFCNSEKRVYRILSLILCIAGFFALFSSNSDSGYLGFAAAFWVLLLINFKNKKSAARVFLILLCFSLCAFLFGIIYSAAGENLRALSNLTQFVSAPEFSLSLAAASVLFFVCFAFLPETKYNYRVIRTVYLILSAVAAAAVVGLIIYFTCFNAEAELGIFNSYLRFSDSWGTDRGFVWKRLISAFNELPFFRKLIGTGEDSVYYVLMNFCKDEMLSFGEPFDNAHSDYIQYLITGGVLTLASYLALIFFSVRTYIKQYENAPLCYCALIVPFTAFLAQSAVNITQPITTPYVFIFIALLNTKLYEQDFSEPKKKKAHK